MSSYADISALSPFARAIKLAMFDCELGFEDMHDYQHMAVKFLMDNPFSALFIDLGLGKSIISLTAISQLLLTGEAKKVLVIAPKRVANETWPTEIGVWRHTCLLRYALVRDDDLVDAVNAAGEAARKAFAEKIGEEIAEEQQRSRMRVANVGGSKGEQTKAAARAKSRVLAKYKQDLKIVSDKARRVAARKAVREHMAKTNADVHIINREQVEFLVKAWGKQWPYDTVFIDESSSL